MTEQDYREAKKACYSLAHSLGSNRSEQESLVNALRGIELTNDLYEPTIKQMLAVFYDGLAYGNWPWVLAKVNKR